MFFYARKKVYRGVGATVGLASEGITTNKAHKAEREQQDADFDNEGTEFEIDSDSNSNLDVQHDHERQWDLDEAQDRLLPPNANASEPSIIDDEQLAESFAQRHPFPETYEKPTLPYPAVRLPGLYRPGKRIGIRGPRRNLYVRPHIHHA